MNPVDEIERFALQVLEERRRQGTPTKSRQRATQQEMEGRVQAAIDHVAAELERHPPGCEDVTDPVLAAHFKSWSSSVVRAMAPKLHELEHLVLTLFVQLEGVIAKENLDNLDSQLLYSTVYGAVSKIMEVFMHIENRVGSQRALEWDRSGIPAINVKPLLAGLMLKYCKRPGYVRQLRMFDIASSRNSDYPEGGIDSSNMAEIVGVPVGVLEHQEEQEGSNRLVPNRDHDISFILDEEEEEESMAMEPSCVL